ncbi:MAG: 4-hydroxy-tetrahydrodipicolinate reductase [Prevotellaceae bacterium]|nr:4-hydroxy-tetrahydrodipicolinate reductase [Prevotellaceae bacterium]
MKIALIGYGRMGRMVEELARESGHEIVSIIDVDNREDMDSPAFRSADVAIEFTTPKSAWLNCRYAIGQGVKVVCGTTGWFNEERRDEAATLCAKSGGTLLCSPNFSIGVAVTRLVSNRLSELMNRLPQYEPLMIETHHAQKRDHPSGTAIQLAEDIVSRVDRMDGWHEQLDKRSDKGLYLQPLILDIQSGHNLRVLYRRDGDAAGEHLIEWQSDDDRITLIHHAYSRRGFARGALMAAEYAAKHTGLLSMDDVLEDLFHTK